jgi:hypothetical protein
MRRTTCSIFSSKSLGASAKSRCASSKKNTSLGFGRSPTSGSRSNSSDSNQSRNVAYTVGDCISLSAARMLIVPCPLAFVCHQIVEVEGRLAEERLRPLLLEREEVPLDGADAGLGDVPVLRLERLRVFPHELDHGPQILEVEEQQAAVVGHLEEG